MDPENDLYYRGIGNCKRYQQNYEESYQWYEKALEKNSEKK